MVPASVLFAEGATRAVFEWGRIDSNADWVLPLVVVAALAVFARYMIRADTVELSPRTGWLFTILRFGAICCLLMIYLQPRWRSEREVVRNSRALLLVDTSSSMGLADIDASLAPSASNRLEQVVTALKQTDFLQRLRQKHDVAVLHFDEDLHRVASLGKLRSAGASKRDTSDEAAGVGKGSGVQTGRPSRADDDVAEEEPIDWEEAFAPTGTQTRLGQVLRQLIHEERSSPLSGIVVFSDGGQNAGIPPEGAIEAAREAKIPIFTVGVGSEHRATNVRVFKLEVPPQAHPGDPYSVTGLIQAQGLAGQSVTVQLLMREPDNDAGPSDPGSGTPVLQEAIVLGGDGEAVPVKFELTPSETGRRTICLRVQPPQSDSNPGDDFLEDEIEIVDRKIRVLLFAGGPTREYRFLRTQLYRDASTTVDVLLQTGQAGMSQEADRILDEFPASREEMYAYDCLVAFDPNWQMLTTGQIDLLESWVGEQGGGLILIAGPVYTEDPISGWVQDEELGRIRALYPVEFQRRLSVFESRSYVSSEPWPLDFTREGLEAEFLWLEDTASASQQAWAEMAGVYSYFPVRGPKPGARVLARFSDPQASRGDQQPVYFAEQFYGSGRVFYLGSGEMWRLRRVDAGYFERLYTRLIRHVSQGRLLRQSSRGALMVGQDRAVLGETVEIRARLTNARLEPLEAPEVPLDAFLPDGRIQTVTLRPDSSRPGMFGGQLTVLSEGAYRLELLIPESDDERLSRRIKVELPDLERQNPQRNDKLLSRIAQGTNGRYYQRLQSAVDPKSPDSLVEKLKDRTKTIIQTGSLSPPSLRWLLEQQSPHWLREQAWFAWLVHRTWLQAALGQTVLWWLMILVCSLLCSEWLIRRLVKLA